jgi:hypothetical protein
MGTINFVTTELISMPLSTPFLERFFGFTWAIVTGAECLYYNRSLLLFVSLINILVSGEVITAIRSFSLQILIIAFIVSIKGPRDLTIIP